MLNQKFKFFANVKTNCQENTTYLHYIDLIVNRCVVILLLTPTHTHCIIFN